MYDFHTHLNAPHLFPERKACIRRFISKGGKGLVNAGADEVYNKNGISIAKVYEKEFGPDEKEHFQLGTTLGYHPYEVCKETPEAFVRKEIIDEKIKELWTLYEENKKRIWAIGECGFDFHYTGSYEKKHLQEYLFVRQIECAQKANLPLVIHSRDAFVQTREILKSTLVSEMKDSSQKEKTLLYFHCRGYGPHEVEKVLNVFPTAMIGICSNVTYKNADAIKESLMLIPVENLVLETDAPYLPPLSHRGQKNEPAFIPFLYAFVSEQKKISTSELIAHMEGNWKKLRKK